jgi:glycerophosphoryl diester phosphodiesterase
VTEKTVVPTVEPNVMATIDTDVVATAFTNDVPTGVTNHTLIIAHRGARSLAPENTMAAARKAFEVGAGMWELDVAVTSDQELVLLHDDTLDRTCNAKDLFPGKVPWRVWEFSLSEISTLDCGTWFIRTDPFGQIKAGAVSQEEANSYAGEPIPTLRTALEYTRENDWRVNVELKDQPNDEYGQILVEKTVALIHELGMDDGNQVAISSFNHEYLTMVQALNPNIPVQALTSKKIKNLPEYLLALGTDSCNPKVDVWSPDELAAFIQDGLEFNVWTVNDEATMKQLLESNVSGIITDYPQKLINILKN